MMFFQDTRSIGVVFWIAAILNLVETIVVLSVLLFDNMTDFSEIITNREGFYFVIGIGALLSAAIYLLNAHRMMSRKMSRLEILRRYVLTVGLCALIDGISVGLSVYLYTSDPDAGIVMTVFTLILSVILILLSMYIANGKKGVGKKVVWAILVIVFGMMLITSLMPAENYWQYAENITNVLIAFFMLTFVLDREVRIDMGVQS